MSDTRDVPDETTRSVEQWFFPESRGRTKYKGFAALFKLENGTEFIVLAPTIDALDEVVQSRGIRSGWEVDRDRCVEVEMRRVANA